MLMDIIYSDTSCGISLFLAHMMCYSADAQTRCHAANLLGIVQPQRSCMACGRMVWQ